MKNAPDGAGPGADPRFLGAVATAEAIERGVTSPRWPQLGLPVVERGPLSIFPLARAANTDPEEGLARLWRQLSMELSFIYGGYDLRVNLVRREDPYGVLLADAGSVGAWSIWWRVKESAVVFVRSIDLEREVDTLAFHVVPRLWVWEPRGLPTGDPEPHDRQLIHARDAADVAWVWPD